MLQPRTYEGRPLWGRAVYTALHGARLSSVPSGDQSANPASVPGRSGLQRAFLSVSSAQKCSGAGRLATPSGVSRAARSAVPCRSSAPGHRASRSKYTRDQSRETGSLSRLFGSMETAAKCVSMGHAHCRTRLCGALPQPFYGVTPMLVGPEQALVMEQEVSTLLREETIEFSQACFSAGLAHSTLKVYVAAIATYHAPLGGLSVGKTLYFRRFLRWRPGCLC